MWPLRRHPGAARLPDKPGASIEGRLGRINKEKANGKAKAKAKGDAEEAPAEATATTLKAAQSGG